MTICPDCGHWWAERPRYAEPIPARPRQGDTPPGACAVRCETGVYYCTRPADHDGPHGCTEQVTNLRITWEGR